MTRGIIGIIFAVLGLAQAGVPDGAWNGKPWDRGKLETAVEQKQPEALAEMAYWSIEGFQATPYDEGRIFELAKQASDAGNPYGQALFSWCYLKGVATKPDLRQAERLARLSSEAGHPQGTKSLANCLVQERGAKGYPEWKTMTELAAAAGCQTAFANLLTSYEWGMNGFKRDRSESMRMALEAMRRETHPGLVVCQIVLTRANTPAEEPGITDEIIARALGRLEDAAEAGVAGPMTVVGRYYVQKGDPARGIPLLLKAANKGDSIGQRMVFEYLDSPQDRQMGGMATDPLSYYHLGNTISATNTENHKVLYAAAMYHLTGPKPDPKRAQELGQQLIARGMTCRCVHQVMGRVHFSTVSGDRLDPKRGIAHYIYGSSEDNGLIRDLGVSFLRLSGKNLDRARGYAAFTRFVKLRPGEQGDVTMLKELWDEMSPDEREEGKEWVAKDYPVADEFRKPAMQQLIELGDLPKDTEFRSFYPER